MLLELLEPLDASARPVLLEPVLSEAPVLVGEAPLEPPEPVPLSSLTPIGETPHPARKPAKTGMPTRITGNQPSPLLTKLQNSLMPRIPITGALGPAPTARTAPDTA